MLGKLLKLASKNEDVSQEANLSLKKAPEKCKPEIVNVIMPQFSLIIS